MPSVETGKTRENMLGNFQALVDGIFKMEPTARVLTNGDIVIGEGAGNQIPQYQRAKKELTETFGVSLDEIKGMVLHAFESSRQKKAA